MYEAYITKGGRRLRLGYTTGTCAAAAAKAAAQLLLGGETMKCSAVTVAVPAGDEIPVEIETLYMEAGRAFCAVRKDGGDDPDATHGMLICASVSFLKPGETPDADFPQVRITGGRGIGRVTKPGLDRPVGEAAINSVPRRMITEHVHEVMRQHGCSGSLQVEISAPDGEEIAKKTFNPHLGIEGGISIIGTSGIVEPMSDAAILGTVKAELSVRKAAGDKIAFFTLGNYGKSFMAQHLPDLSDKTVTCSNFIGDSIDLALEAGFEGILFLGHFGKLVKLGAGIMNTHSSFADGRMDVLVSCALTAGADLSLLHQIQESITTDAAIGSLRQSGEKILQGTMEQLTERVDFYLRKKVKDAVPIGAILFTQTQNVTVETAQVPVLMRMG